MLSWGKMNNFLYITFDCEDFINIQSIFSLYQILKILKKYNVKALFFITGHMSEKLDARARKLARAKIDRTPHQAICENSISSIRSLNDSVWVPSAPPPIISLKSPTIGKKGLSG